MIEMAAQNWIFIVLALVVGVLVAWWIFAASRRTKVEIEPREEDEAKPAKRNQALIDAPPAAAASDMPPPPAETPPGETPPAVAPVVDPAPAPASRPTPEPAPEPAPEPDPDPAPEPIPAPAAEPITPIEPAGSPPIAEPAPLDAGGADDLTRIKGVGPKLATTLRDLGITSFAQIAAWDEAEIDRIDVQLGRFQGRIRRDNWVEQARYLASGDTAGYESQFGRL